MKRKPLILITLLAILTIATFPLIMGCSEPATEPTTTATPAAPASTPTPAPASPAPAPAPSSPAPEPEAGETIELRYLAGSQGMAGVDKPTLGRWAEEVEAASNGRVKINILIGAAPEPELYDMVARGGGDMAGNPIMFNTGRFPTLEAMNLPDIGTVCKHPGRAAWEFWKTFPEIDQEFSDVKLLGLFAPTSSPPGISFATVGKPVLSLEDIQGVKMGIYGQWGTKTLEALGAVPVSVSVVEAYESCQRKIVDGTVMDPEMLIAFRIFEVVDYWHNCNLMFSPYWFVINTDTWNGLPEDVQKLFEDKATEIPDWADSYLKETVTVAIDISVNEYGIEVIDFSDEELERWRELQQPVQDEYIAMLNEKGIDGEKVFAELQRLYEKHAEW